MLFANHAPMQPKLARRSTEVTYCLRALEFFRRADHFSQKVETIVLFWTHLYRFCGAWLSPLELSCSKSTIVEEVHKMIYFSAGSPRPIQRKDKKTNLPDAVNKLNLFTIPCESYNFAYFYKEIQSFLKYMMIPSHQGLQLRPCRITGPFIRL